jgi:hypothetical protein
VKNLILAISVLATWSLAPAAQACIGIGPMEGIMPLTMEPSLEQLTADETQADPDAPAKLLLTGQVTRGIAPKGVFRGKVVVELQGPSVLAADLPDWTEGPFEIQVSPSGSFVLPRELEIPKGDFQVKVTVKKGMTILDPVGHPVTPGSPDIHRDVTSISQHHTDDIKKGELHVVVKLDNNFLGDF